MPEGESASRRLDVKSDQNGCGMEKCRCKLRFAMGKQEQAVSASRIGANWVDLGKWKLPGGLVMLVLLLFAGVGVWLCRVHA